MATKCSFNPTPLPLAGLTPIKGLLSFNRPCGWCNHDCFTNSHVIQSFNILFIRLNSKLWLCIVGGVQRGWFAMGDSTKRGSVTNGAIQSCFLICCQPTFQSNQRKEEDKSFLVCRQVPSLADQRQPALPRYCHANYPRHRGRWQGQEMSGRWP